MALKACLCIFNYCLRIAFEIKWRERWNSATQPATGTRTKKIEAHHSYCDCYGSKRKKKYGETHKMKRNENKSNQKLQTIIVIDNDCNNGTSIKQCKWVRKVLEKRVWARTRATRYVLSMRIQRHKFPLALCIDLFAFDVELVGSLSVSSNGYVCVCFAIDSLCGTIKWDYRVKSSTIGWCFTSKDLKWFPTEKKTQSHVAIY